MVVSSYAFEVCGLTKRRFAVASRETMPPFEPDMPNPPVFERGPAFRDFLLEKRA